MPLTAIEGIVENGTIRLRDNVALPENARVFVIVAGPADESRNNSEARIRSPRLVNPQQSKDFRKQVVEPSADAGI